ncbi:cytochrome C oxidase Cbb3 [Stutzerimonas decontaminans]|jgi:mono/diheme cytochrome c family protein|uniref:Cytochrome C oxidase Cbb3 n=2 Tax=Stutzerimonas TaxID=2901164 RepID=A0ABX4W0S4_9GAMM|nr:cytochrome c [Stutzerimonas decontaminans]AHY43522.1 cytochrome Cbb3 [Stutzerimonas decontaminans]MCQ4245646.1 cytochrome c [Stutzerimonas decontaminans]PNF84965.1 cytochrome C oxidase Cbb3 [Stutzerimonas decontaminans]
MSIFNPGLVAAISLLAVAVAATPASAANPPPFSKGETFEETTGEDLFNGICQGCHMEGGQGAIGAGAYPALKDNPRVASAAYPIYMVVNGQGGMPSFKDYLSDQQIAEVVNYVRTHFDNNFPDAVSVEDVRKISLR